MSKGSTWPEQDAIDNWVERKGLNLGHSDTIDLKHQVTECRLETQLLYEKERQRCDEISAENRRLIRLLMEVVDDDIAIGQTSHETLHEINKKLNATGGRDE